MGWRSDINSWLTKKLGWYGAFVASGACITLIACSIAALVLQKSPAQLLIPGLMGIATFAVTGPFFGFAAKDPHRVRIRLALGGVAVLGLCGPITLFYSAFRLGLIDQGTLDGLLISSIACLPFVVLTSYFVFRAMLKGKKELV